MKKLFSLMLLLATMVSFTACSSDDDGPSKSTLSQTNYTLYAGKTVSLEGEGLKNLNWIGDDFVAKVDKDGVLHGNKVGYTYIKSKDITSGSLGLFAVVKPLINSFSEPLLYNRYLDKIEYKNGAFHFQHNQSSRMPESDIWGLHSSFLSLNIKQCGLPWTLYKSTSDTRVYKTDKAASPYVIYMLDDNSQIIGAGVYVDPLKSSELSDFIDERYLIYDVDISSYTANFAHAIMDNDGNEVFIDYVGKMGYSASLKMIIIAYSPVQSNGRVAECDILERLMNISIDK